MAKPPIRTDPDQDKAEIYKTAANALLLARRFFLIQYWDLPRETRKLYGPDDSADKSGFYLFRERMYFWEIIDDQLESPFEDVKFPWLDERNKDLIMSDENFAKITLNDLPLSKSNLATLEVAAGGLDRVAMERPICRWWPGPLISELRKIVSRYLETYFATAEIKPAPSNVNKGPRTAGDLSRESEMAGVLTNIVKSNPGRKATRATTLKVLREYCGFSGNASKRIWGNFSKEHWGRPGPLEAGVEITSEELASLIKSEN